MFKALEWKQHKLYAVDQSKLPEKVMKIHFRSPQQIAEAIRDMKIACASTIGVAAAFAVYLGIQHPPLAKNYQKLMVQIDKVCQLLYHTQCNVTQLAWALERMKRCAQNNRDHKLVTLRGILLREVLTILREDEKVTQSISALGSEIIRNNDQILIYGNSATFSTHGPGPTIGILLQAAARHETIRALVSETRPYLYGSRLVPFLLKNTKIPFHLITDNMAAHLMKREKVNVVVVGADGIAMNGDVMAEIGSYGLAMLAYHHNVPFYVAAPISSFARNIFSGDTFTLQERKPDAVLAIQGKSITLRGVKALNPVNDLIPHKYISALITELGIIRAPFDQNLRNLFSTLV